MNNKRISELDGTNALRTAYAFLEQEITDSRYTNHLEAKLLFDYMAIKDAIFDHYINKQW